MCDSFELGQMCSLLHDATVIICDILKHIWLLFRV